MRLTPPCLAALLLIGVGMSPAMAQQVYKCKDANGKTVYAQNPCANLADPSQMRLSTQTGATSFAGADPHKDSVALAEAKAKADAKVKDDAEKAEKKRTEDIKELDRRANRCAMLVRQGNDFERKLKPGAGSPAYEDVSAAYNANRKEQTAERCATVRDEQRLMAADAQPVASARPAQTNPSTSPPPTATASPSAPPSKAAAPRP